MNKYLKVHEKCGWTAAIRRYAKDKRALDKQMDKLKVLELHTEAKMDNDLFDFQAVMDKEEFHRLSKVGELSEEDGAEDGPARKLLQKQK